MAILYSRYIVGWDLSATMTSKDVQEAKDTIASYEALAEAAMATLASAPARKT